MEKLNLERLNKLIDLYSVLGVFALIACVLIISYLVIKILRWSLSDYIITVEKKDNKE